MFSAAPTVRGEGELAFLSSSMDLGTVCWKTLGDSRTEDAAVVVAVTSGEPATCKGNGHFTSKYSSQVQRRHLLTGRSKRWEQG